MRRIFFALALLLCSALSVAQSSINLSPAPCASGVWCANVPNNAGESILITGGPSFQNIGAIIGKPDGSTVSYQAPNYSATYVGTCPAAPAMGIYTVTNAPLQGVSGPATMTVNFSCTQNYAHSGRAGGWHSVWTLVSGVISIP